MGRTPLEDGPSADSFGWNDGMVEGWGEGMPIAAQYSIVPVFHYSLVPSASAFRIPASTACARSLIIPGTCDLTDGRSNATK